MESSLRNTEAEHTATLTPSEEDWKRGMGGIYLPVVSSFVLFFSSVGRCVALRERATGLYMAGIIHARTFVTSHQQHILLLRFEHIVQRTGITTRKNRFVQPTARAYT